MSFTFWPKEMFASLWHNKFLLKTLVEREVAMRYRGAMFGLIWSLLNPIFMLAIYTFVFSVVFKARWSTGSDSKTEFALVLFAGLLVFNFFSECVNRAPSLILANANYVKKVIFPLEILPWAVLGSAAFHALMGLLVWLLAYMIFFGPPHMTILWLPVVTLPLFLYCLGFMWLLSSLGVYLRDISQLIGTLTTVLMFLSPIFYPITALPEEYRIFLKLNPLTQIVENVRDVMFWGKSPELKPMLISLACSAAVASFGFAWFQKTRKGFADVI